MIPLFLAAAAFQEFMLGSASYRAELRSDLPKPLRVLRGGKLVAAEAKREWKPWRLEVADVDGDGNQDLALGVLKSTRNIPAPHTTLFIYGFDGKRITKKWLGSTMGRPLVDFCFGDIVKGKGQTLYTLEKAGKGQTALSHYEWSGFGFHKLPGEITWPSANRLHFERGKITLEASGKKLTMDAGENLWKDR